MTETQATPLGIADEWEIRHVVDEIDNAVDAKDWTGCRSYFTDEIYADFSSLSGGEGGRMPADSLVGAWQHNLYADKLSHHMRTNHRITIDGDRAEVFSKGCAFNMLPSPRGSDLWEVWGNYTHTLERTPDGWKVSGMTFVVTYARGNERARDFVPPAEGVGGLAAEPVAPIKCLWGNSSCAQKFANGLCSISTTTCPALNLVTLRLNKNARALLHGHSLKEGITEGYEVTFTVMPMRLLLIGITSLSLVGVR